MFTVSGKTITEIRKARGFPDLLMVIGTLLASLIALIGFTSAGHAAGTASFAPGVVDHAERLALMMVAPAQGSIEWSKTQTVLVMSGALSVMIAVSFAFASRLQSDFANQKIDQRHIGLNG